MTQQGWSKDEMARRVAERLKPGSFVNLGIGMPASVVAAVDPEDGIVFHCENGIVGYRALELDEQPDPATIDAGSAPVGLIPGASIVALDQSFAIARGGRLDVTVLGAFQVSEKGDLANWKAPQADLAGIGGAMDLAAGANEVFVMMRHTERSGALKIVRECTYPLTAPRCVTTIVTEYAVMRVTPTGLTVEQLADGVDRAFLQSVTEPELSFAELVTA